LNDADRDQLRSVVAAWGRRQAAFGGETARFFVEVDLTVAEL
jgi:hypothetical protein